MLHPYLSALLLLLALALSACSAHKPWVSQDLRNWEQQQPAQTKVEHTWLLVGDAGKAQDNDPVMQLIQARIDSAEGPVDVLYLGDNIYPDGLPEPGSPDRPEAEAHLEAQLAAARSARQQFYIPGNHDWNSSHSGGWETVQRQEAYLERRLNNRNAFLPDGGCPGPTFVEIDETRVLVVLDSQWWVHPAETPEYAGSPCANATEHMVLYRLRRGLQQYANRQVLLAAHHPLYSNGAHGDTYTLEDHLFPTLLFGSNLYIPLPVVGSAYPLLRKASQNNTDLTNRDYRRYANKLSDLLREHPNVIYASGHEHNLQLFQRDSIHYIVSGSGSKQNPVAKRRGADFVAGKKGLAELLSYSDGSRWVQFWGVTADGGGELLFRKQLHTGQAPVLSAR